MWLFVDVLNIENKRKERKKKKVACCLDSQTLPPVLSSLSKHLDIPRQISLSPRGLGLIIRLDLTTKKRLVRLATSEVFLSEAFTNARPSFFVLFSVCLSFIFMSIDFRMLIYSFFSRIAHRF